MASFLISWVMPFSLNITDAVDIFYYTMCIKMPMYGCINFTSDPQCAFPRLCNASLMISTETVCTSDLFPDIDVHVIYLTLFAVNGAGEGKPATVLYTSTNGMY